MKAPITASLAALTLAGLLSGQAFAQTTTPSASSSPAAHRNAGCPDGFDQGDAAGVRICHGRGGWRLATTDPARTGSHEYTGTLTTNGTFGDVYLVRPEQDDSASIDGNGNLAFDFKTYSGIDGVHFRVDGGNALTFNLSLDGQQLPPQRIWIGDRGRHPDGDPFTLTIHRHRAAASPSPS